jgi:hypothetical protein
MDKGKKKSKVKTVKMPKTLNNRQGGKSNYLRNNYNSMYLCSNLNGNVYLNELSPNKWEFIITDTAGVYYLKYLPTGLCLSSNESGDLFTTLLEWSSYQKWKLMNTSELQVYALVNSGNGFVLFSNNDDKLLLYEISDKDYDDAQPNKLFFTFPAFPKK